VRPRLRLRVFDVVVVERVQPPERTSTHSQVKPYDQRNGREEQRWRHGSFCNGMSGFG